MDAPIITSPTTDSPRTLTVRALQLGERIDIKGLERADGFSKNPLAFSTPSGGAVVLFKSGAAVFIGLNPIEEDDIIRGLGERVSGPATDREIETADIAIKSDDDTVAANGTVHLKNAEPYRLLLVAEALAIAVSLSYDERRVGRAFDRVAQVAEGLKAGTLLSGKRSDTLAEIGEALTIQSRLAGRIGMDDKPDVLWDHPELERLWVKLADEFDLKSRANAVAQKLAVIRDSTETLGDMLSTRTSHRLEWYIIALIAFEIGLSLYDRIMR
jgi:uncharacterized Rmd1/YagE family protein